MPYSYDDQVVETVVARRRRIESALMLGQAHARRTWSGRLGPMMGGVFVAALICAGCVAASIVVPMMRNDPTMRPGRALPTSGVTSQQPVGATSQAPAGPSTSTGSSASAGQLP